MKRLIDGSTWLGFSIQVGWLASQFSTVRQPYSFKNSWKAASQALPVSGVLQCKEQLFVVRGLLEEGLESHLPGLGSQIEHLPVCLEDLVVEARHEIVEQTVVAVYPDEPLHISSNIS